MPMLFASVCKRIDNMVQVNVRASIASLETYDVESIEAPIIVNANESNAPLPEPILKILAEKLPSFAFNRYPQMQAEDLCALIAKDFGCSASDVIIGNGSSELLRVACYVFGGSGKKIMVPVPSFSMYGEYVQLSDSETCTYRLTEDGYIDKEALLAAVKKEQPALLIICNPNNPTGNYNSLRDIENIVRQVDCPVIIDEAYLEFAAGESAYQLLDKYEHIICLKTFSKAYGLAGMRCGYGLGSSKLIAAMRKGILPYGVNAYTLLTAAAVYAHKELYKERILQIKSMRDKMASALRDWGFYVYPAAANFVTFYAQGPLAAELSRRYKQEYQRDLADSSMNSGKYLFEKFKENGILVRDYSTNKNLHGALRVSVGLPEENEQILAVVKKLCEDVAGCGAAK